MKKINYFLKAFCLIIAFVGMSFAFAGCGGTPTPGIFSIQACRAAYEKQEGYKVFSLDSVCADSVNFDRYVEEANKTTNNEAKQNANKRFANAIYAKWGLGELYFKDENLYSNENEKPKTDKQTSVKITNEFILKNYTKFNSTSFITVNGNTQTYFINLLNATDKFKPQMINNQPVKDNNGNLIFTKDAADFIIDARKSNNFGNNVLLIENSDNTKNPNLSDIVLGISSIPENIYEWKV